MKSISMEEIAGKKKTFLFLILVIGFLTRTYVWNHLNVEFGNDGLVTMERNYLDIASSFDPSSTKGFFEHNRASYTIMYPLYLAPIYAFGLKAATYVFWLH